MLYYWFAKNNCFKRANCSWIRKHWLCCNVFFYSLKKRDHLFVNHTPQVVLYAFESLKIKTFKGVIVHECNYRNTGYAVCFWFVKITDLNKSLVYESLLPCCMFLIQWKKRTSSKEPFVYKSHAIFLVLYLKKKNARVLVLWIGLHLLVCCVLCDCNQSNQINPLF